MVNCLELRHEANSQLQTEKGGAITDLHLSIQLTWAMLALELPAITMDVPLFLQAWSSMKVTILPIITTAAWNVGVCSCR
jgi:hypothetical protein